MDERENQRIEQLLKKVEESYPKNMETENYIQEIFKKITKIDKAIIKSSKEVCKTETEELLKYASFNDDMSLDLKDNVNEEKFEIILKNWQKCLQDKNKDFSQTLHLMDTEFNINNQKLNKCSEECVGDSLSKTNLQLETCFKDCLIKHERIFSEVTKKYDDSFKTFEKNYEAYL